MKAPTRLVGGEKLLPDRFVTGAAFIELREHAGETFGVSLQASKQRQQDARSRLPRRV
ncbi:MULTISPECIES: hypothetical protein [unclassified Mesorhizobium]|uniref:hypothetical protein n=1 Tax=unclassified Mesorhizobium TaxID=325217 RepID=UPI0015E3767C|nr:MULTISPECIES: hypothetical protein [unclassified Mesorhizobium]